MSEKQRTASGKSGGMRIDDHKAFMGMGNKEHVLPKGVHVKSYESADSAGSEMEYEETSDQVRSVQEMGEKKAKSHPMKPGYRN